jgi:hypothetical protein
MVFYRLDFAGPLESVSFTRTAIISTSGDAPWIAKALDAQGNVLASANEGFLIGPSARTFTLIGPGITALEIDARNDISQTTFNTPPIDNLTLVTPEPKNSISFSLGLGILLLGVVYRRSIPKSSVAGFSPEGKRHWSPTA